eukprot:3605577-Rhodomonas_salina.2
MMSDDATDACQRGQNATQGTPQTVQQSACEPVSRILRWGAYASCSGCGNFGACTNLTEPRRLCRAAPSVRALPIKCCSCRSDSGGGPCCGMWCRGTEFAARALWPRALSCLPRRSRTRRDSAVSKAIAMTIVDSMSAPRRPRRGSERGGRGLV